MNTITNDNTNDAAVRSKDVRQAAIRRCLNYQMAVKARESMVERKMMGCKGMAFPDE